MKYGLLTYFGAPYCNFGDYVQSIAIEYLYLEIMKIPKDQIVYITEQELKSYDGEQLILPYSYVLAFLLDIVIPIAPITLINIKNPTLV